MKRLSTFTQRISGIGLVLLAPSLLLAQAQSTDAIQFRIRQTVNRVFEQNVRAGTSIVAPGVQAYTRVPLSDSEIGEITSFGQDAIPVLAEYLKNPHVRFRELAVRCIAYIGGIEALHLLETTVLQSGSQNLRMQALEWIGSMPGQAAEVSLKKIENVSSDQSIRARAKALLVKESEVR